MTRIRRRPLWIAPMAALILLAGLLGLTAGQAQAATYQELSLAYAIDTGNYTSTQLNACLNDYGCASIAEDPTWSDTTGYAVSQDQANSELSAQGMAIYQTSSSHCPTGSQEYFMGHAWTHKSLLGSTIYKWHWNVWYCRNNNTNMITRWTHRVDYLTNAQWMVNWTTDQVTSLDSLPASKARAYRQRHLQLCYGGSFACVNRYPWGRGTAYGAGYTPYFTGSDG